jgi:hypothetical protein
MEQVTLPGVEERSAWQCPDPAHAGPLRLIGGYLHCMICGDECEIRPSVIAAKRHAARADVIEPPTPPVRGRPPERNACHNRPERAPPYFAQDGYMPPLPVGDGRFLRNPVFVEVRHVMSEDCKYSEHTADSKCAGCRWNKQEAR